jgi:hypothetical protein
MVEWFYSGVSRLIGMGLHVGVYPGSLHLSSESFLCRRTHCCIAAHPQPKVGLIYECHRIFSKLFRFLGINQLKDGRSRVKNMLRFSLLFLTQLVWIFRSSASPLVERVTIPAPIVVEPSQSCTSSKYITNAPLRL